MLLKNFNDYIFNLGAKNLLKMSRHKQKHKAMHTIFMYLDHRIIDGICNQEYSKIFIQMSSNEM